LIPTLKLETKVVADSRNTKHYIFAGVQHRSAQQRAASAAPVLATSAGPERGRRRRRKRHRGPSQDPSTQNWTTDVPGSGRKTMGRWWSVFSSEGSLFCRV